MGKFKFIFILILAVVCICGIVMVVDAPTTFDDSMSLIPVSDSGNVVQSDCENGSCQVGSEIESDSGNVVQSDCENGSCQVGSVIDGAVSKSNYDSSSKNDDKDNHDDEMDYDSKYYDGSYIEGLYFCNDLDKAFKDAQAHHRNVMIIFDGAACIYCEYLKEDTLTDPDVQHEINENYIILITETSESPELSQQLDIYGTPTTVVFDENANELGRIEDYEPPEEYLSHLKDIGNR